MRNFIPLALFMMLLFPHGASAQARVTGAPREKFISGNDLYKQQKFAEAGDRYAQALATGWESPGLYFNLGNALFKQERFVDALLAYERAQRLDPRDPDIDYNKRLAQARLADHRTSAPSGLWQAVLETAVRRFTEDELAWAGLASLTFALYLIVFVRMRPDLKRSLATALGVSLVVISVSCSALYAKINGAGREAIMTRAVPARFEPFDKATTHFELLAGLKVLIVDRGNGWVKIERPDRMTGWVPQDTLEIV